MKKRIINWLLPDFYKYLPSENKIGSFKIGNCLITPELSFERYHKYYGVYNNMKKAYIIIRLRTLWRAIIS